MGVKERKERFRQEDFVQQMIEQFLAGIAQDPQPSGRPTRRTRTQPGLNA